MKRLYKRLTRWGASACFLASIAAVPAGASAAIPAPVIPDRAFNVADFGAVGDGATLNTASIQKALDACAAAGGGTVLIPAGAFLTGPLTLHGNLNFHLDDKATLLMSAKLSDYPLNDRRYPDCIAASGCHDLAITGGGTIDGQGSVWWPIYRKAAAAADLPHRPFLLVLRDCRRVLVRDVQLRNSPMFHLVPQHCRDVLIDHVRINAPSNSPNTDGIDPSGWNYLITRCAIDVGDDCIAIKPSGTGPLRPAPDSLSCEDFTVADCTFLHGHGMSIGNPTPGGLRRLTVRDCTFDSTDAGVRMKTQRGKGGLVEDMDYENLTMKNVKVAILITSYYPSIPKSPELDPAQPLGPATPIFRHIRIANVTAIGGHQAGRIIGLAEMPVSDLVLENVNISADVGMQIVHAAGVSFIHSRVTAASGPPFLLNDAQVAGIDAMGR